MKEKEEINKMKLALYLALLNHAPYAEDKDIDDMRLALLLRRDEHINKELPMERDNERSDDEIINIWLENKEMLSRLDD